MHRPAASRPSFPLTLATLVLALGVLLVAPSAWAGDMPAKPLKAPNVRHFIRKVDQGSTAKEKNSVLETRVNVSRDVKEINEGKAKKGNESGVMTWTLNGRTYGDHSGTLYPIRGAGVHELNRGAFRALGLYNEFKDTPRAREYMDKMKIPDADRKAGLKAHKAG
ncbi:hypothetical protein [Myxococcus qinghaiensis]|uniref:hypothetical protein n=1 Tax=Myxococcus qinghaiensis TaxID=2906758 RepID=UPI0020A77F1B|nr:hypothetical protein [Myxococcus qinghaiensis]MCP3162310.1 hypothetical protein [Myxococcus qinghaiensis]